MIDVRLIELPGISAGPSQVPGLAFVLRQEVRCD
jgi:hypothetical protein